MKYTECANGHVYDSDQYAVCPYCNNVRTEIRFGPGDGGKTVAPSGYGVPDPGRTVSPGGGNGSTGTGSGNSDKEKENPQSGDHSFIPAAMLLLACASGAVIFTLRKK